MKDRIKLTNGQFALVDPDIYEDIKKWKWRKDHYGYVQRNYHSGKGGQHTIFLHRYIMNPLEGMDIDHINRDPLDNRRSNLRICTRAENNINSKIKSNNTSGYKGVSLHKQMKKWRAYITYKGKQISLGLFDTPHEAHLIRKKKEEELYGEFAS